MRFSSLLLSAASASAAVIARQQNPSTAKLLIGFPGNVAVADFDGKEIKITASNTAAGTAASWMAFKAPNLIYAVDENGDKTRLFKYDAAANTIELVTNSTGATGVVSLEFNAAKTRLVGTSYGGGRIDIWDTSSGTELKIFKQLQSNDTLGPDKTVQVMHRAHQAILDPSGRFFAVSDLGSDSILIIDSKDDAFTITNSNRVPTAGCGPRHGVWYPPKAEKATHFIALCESKNLIQVFSVSYNGTGVGFARTQELSTFAASFPAANVTNARAGEIVVSGDGNDVYVSNRLTGDTTDSIAQFKVKKTAAAGGSPCKAAAGGIELEFADSVSSGGIQPRMFSLSKDEKTVFVGNQNGKLGLVAFDRAPETGKLKLSSVPSMPNTFFGTGDGPGPQFVQQIA